MRETKASVEFVESLMKAESNGSGGGGSGVVTSGTGQPLSSVSSQATTSLIWKANPQHVYRKDATLGEIFGSGVKPGRALLDSIFKAYKA